MILTPWANTVVWRCVALAFIACCGCSDGPDLRERKPTVRVTGSVFVSGKPAAGALVSYQRRGGPDPSSPGAQGVVDAEGSYQLTTYETNDGVIAGEYVVGVMWPSRPDWWNAEGTPADIDRLGGRYTADKSEIVCTVDETTTSIKPIEIK